LTKLYKAKAADVTSSQHHPIQSEIPRYFPQDFFWLFKQYLVLPWLQGGGTDPNTAGERKVSWELSTATRNARGAAAHSMVKGKINCF
jgi:hypothetical protein